MADRAILHDGRAATLVDIFTKYTKDKMGKTSDLTDAELGQLARYLQELDDVPETPVADEEVAIAGGGFLLDEAGHPTRAGPRGARCASWPGDRPTTTAPGVRSVDGAEDAAALVVELAGVEPVEAITLFNDEIIGYSV